MNVVHKHLGLKVERLMELLDICQISCKKKPPTCLISHLCPLSACVCLSQTLTLTLEPLQMNFGLSHMTHILQTRQYLIYHLLSATPPWLQDQIPLTSAVSFTCLGTNAGKQLQECPDRLTAMSSRSCLSWNGVWHLLQLSRRMEGQGQVQKWLNVLSVL